MQPVRAVMYKILDLSFTFGVNVKTVFWSIFLSINFGENIKRKLRVLFLLFFDKRIR